MDQGEQVNSLKVSVIIPVYNTGAYVEEAVRSIMNQTLREIEIIVIDDGSTDNSLSVIEKLAREDNRIQYLSQVNQGQSVARNVGIEKAAGAYVYIMDSDDFLEDNALLLCYEKAKQGKLDFVVFNAVILNEENDFGISLDYKQPFLDEKQVYSGQSMLSQMLDQQSYRCSPCIHFIRYRFLESTHLRFYPGIIHEDELFTALLYMQSQRAGYIPRPFFKRRFRADSVMTSTYSLRNVNSYLIVAEQLLLFANKADKHARGLIDELLSYILNPNIYRANALSFRERGSIFLKCLRNGFVRYISLKTLFVLLFPWTIKIKGFIRNKTKSYF